MNILSIDPGKHGGVAYFEEGVLIDTYQFAAPSKPRIPDETMGQQFFDWGCIDNFIPAGTTLVIEAPVFKHLPTAIQHRVTQNIVYGMQLQNAMDMIDGGEVVFSEPTHWKKRMGLTADKKEALRMARELYPDLDAIKLEKNDGVAEAILIGIDYIRQQEQKENV